MDAPVTITVKSPVQATDTHVQISLSSTVLQLKQRLQQDHQAKPEPTTQRIIYSGRLLRDEEVLSDVFLPVRALGDSLLFVASPHDRGLFTPTRCSISPILISMVYIQSSRDLPLICHLVIRPPATAVRYFRYCSVADHFFPFFEMNRAISEDFT
jgi:hypothetical protein